MLFVKPNRTLILAPTVILLLARIAAADSVLVEFRSPDGTPLVAAGDASTPYGVDDAAAAQKRVEARAAAIGTARRALLRSLPPALLQRSYRNFPLVAGEIDADDRRVLAANPLVVAVHENRLRRPSMASALAYIGASRWQAEGYTGAGTAVAVLDTGIRYWSGFFGTCAAAGDAGCRVKVFEGFATLTLGTGTTDPIEVANAEAHGTNVGGIVGAMAPGADLLSLGVFGLYDPDPSTGFEGGTAASDGDVVSALDWSIEHRTEYNIVSANMSLGSEPDPEMRGYCTGWMAGSYSGVFANCRDAGILPVVATGNEYVKTAVASPACIASAVRVGAAYDDPAFGYSCGTGPVVPGAVTCFSNSSALVDLIAPGNDIDAAGLLGYSGTSMAAPQVSGLAAVYQARYGTDALWTLERMRVDAVPVPEAYAAQPYIHRYIRMGDHDAVLRFDTGQVLASDFRGLAIPDGGPTAREVSAAVTCTSEDCASDTVGAVYVDLNIVHPATGELVFELAAPDGTTARHEVADDAELGKDNVNSLLGSQHLPGIFDALKGAPIAGTWTLRVFDDTDAVAGNSGSLHRAVLLIDSARVRLEGTLVAPALARPGEPFDVSVTLANRGNQVITAAPLVVELIPRGGGAAVDSAPLEPTLPLAPGEASAVPVRLSAAEQGEYDVRVVTTGLTPGLAPGLVAEPVPVSVTQRTFASFGVDPRLPTVAEEARLLDWSVGLIDSYSWEFGDGGRSLEPNPVHTWTWAGEHVVRLTVTGPDGSSTVARSILVMPAGWTGDPDSSGGPGHQGPAGGMSASGGGCGCRTAEDGSRPGGLVLLVLSIAGVLTGRRRRRQPNRSDPQSPRASEARGSESTEFLPRLVARDKVRGAGAVVCILALAAAVVLSPACDGGGNDGGDADGGSGIDGDVDAARSFGPWVSLLDPADPSEGNVELWLRVGHERSLPCDLTVEYRVGEGDWLPATLDDPAALAGVATAPWAGVELHLSWRSTTDLPGDQERVELRIGASDGELDAVPVVSAPFAVLNFFVTHPRAVLITEVSTAERNVPGSNRDAYVELRNVTTEDLTLDGWKLVATSASGAREEYALDGLALPTRGRRTVVESGAEYAGGWPLDRELPWNTEGYGAVALVASYDRAVDFVRWGGSAERPPAGTSWTDDTPLPVPQTLTALNRIDEAADTDQASDFCVAPPSPDETSSGCLPRLSRGAVLVTELSAAGSEDRVEVSNHSGAPVNLGGWVLLWDGDDLGSGEIPLASYDLPDGGRLALRDGGIAGRVRSGMMELGVNMSLDGLVPIAVGFRDPYGDVIDFLAAGGSTIRWTDWTETEPTPMPGPTTTLSRRPGDPDTDSAADFCLTEPNLGAAPAACLEPLGITLRISEIMPGRPDWFELYNPGPDPVDLSQVYLSYTAAFYGGSVEDYRLTGTLAAGERAVVIEWEGDLPDVTDEIVLPNNVQLSSNSDGSVALRDVYGFGIDFVMWGEPAGTPLWPDHWLGLGADVYPTDEDNKSIERVAPDEPDTDRREDWCWAAPSPGRANAACE